MRTHISSTPAQDGGAYLQQKLGAHRDQNILLLASGGSSLSVLEHIDSMVLGPHVTLCTSDERYSYEETGSNFKQLQKSSFYAKALEAGATCLPTIPQDGETHSEFATRIENILKQYKETYPNCYTLGVLGIGDDGHTGGIFPASETDFNALYESDALYVANVQENVQYPYRTTITPMFIEDMMDDVVLFAVGSNKCDNILNYMHNKNFSRFQIPALIPARHPQSILFTDCTTIE